jgi:uncharacterized protein YndB with AHSA1/START domain
MTRASEPRNPEGRDSEDFAENTAPGEVRLERLLPGPVERIWAYLTDGEKRGRWLAAGSTEQRVGGKVVLKFRHADLSAEQDPPPQFAAYKDGHTMEGTVTRCEPGRLLSYTWGDGRDDTEVSFELEPRGTDVLLTVTQRRLRSRAGMANVAAGWHVHLGILLDHLAGREPRGFWSNHARLEAAYTARLSTARPLPQPQPE